MPKTSLVQELGDQETQCLQPTSQHTAQESSLHSPRGCNLSVNTDMAVTDRTTGIADEHSNACRRLLPGFLWRQPLQTVLGTL